MARTPDKKRIQVHALLDKGLVRWAVGRRDEAIRLWREAADLAPGNTRALDYLQSVGAIATGSVTAATQPVEIGPDADSLIGGEGSPPPFTTEVPSITDEMSAPEDSGPVMSDVDILMAQVQKCRSTGRSAQALQHCEEVLKKDPDHAEAGRHATELRRELTAVYLKNLEPTDRVPFLRATDASILELSLDPIGGFLISQIDGHISIDDLLTILSTFDQFRVLSSLHFFLESGIIELRAPR